MDIPAFEEPSSVIYTLNEHGYVQSIDIHTGEVTQLEGNLVSPPTSFDISKLRKVVTQDGSIAYVHKSIPKEELAKLQGTRISFPYSPILADQICEKIAMGSTLMAISKEPHMPSYSQLCQWRREHVEFDQMYALARRDRGEAFFTKLLEEADRAIADRDEIALSKLRADIFKFAAKVSAPDDFAEKSTVDARVAVGEFTIETGIRREGDAGFNRDETALLAIQQQISNSGEDISLDSEGSVE